MDGRTFIVPSPEGTRWSELEAVPLALARETQGRLFEKHILSTGTLIHPKTGERIRVDDAFLDSMVRNFRDNVCDIVQVPLANDSNEHVEGPAANIGETVALRQRGGKLYAVCDVRDADHAKKVGKTYLGASAFLSTNYTDSRDGKKKGPTLLHVAVTNRPYVVGLEPYKEIAALTASDIGGDEIFVLTQEESHVSDKDELIRQLRDEHGIDVTALQASASRPAPPAGVDSAALSHAVAQALAANPTLAALTAGGVDGLTMSDLAGAVVELSRQNTVISEGYQGLRRERAEDVVDKLIGTGHILPKQREFAIDLKLTGSPEKWEQFVPAEPVVPVNQQVGLTGGDGDDVHRVQDQQSEVDRLTKVYTEHVATSNRVPARAGK